MRSFVQRLTLLLVAGVSAVALFAATTSADGTKPAYKPVANVKNVKNAINGEEHGLYGMVVQACQEGEKGKKVDRNLMRHRVAMLEEAGNLLAQMEPTQGEYASWRKHAEAFRDAANPIKKLITKKKYADARKQLAELKKRCDACHDAHRSN